MSVTMPKKSKGRGEDRHMMPRLAFHLPQELLDAFRAYVAEQPLVPSEATALRVALEEFLQRRGAWPPPAG